MASCLIIGLALCTLASAVISAVFWFKSAAVKIPYDGDEIKPSISDAPEQHILNAQVEIIYIRDAMEKACKLNKTAAIWTGIAALLGALTSIVGTVF